MRTSVSVCTKNREVSRVVVLLTVPTRVSLFGDTVGHLGVGWGGVVESCVGVVSDLRRLWVPTS